MSPLPPLPVRPWPMTAVRWRLGDPSLAGDEVEIVARAQRDGSTRYAVTKGGWTANHDGEWEYEPIPSSRDDGYIARCRWDDWGQAAEMAQRMVGVA